MDLNAKSVYSTEFSFQVLNQRIKELKTSGLTGFQCCSHQVVSEWGTADSIENQLMVDYSLRN